MVSFHQDGRFFKRDHRTEDTKQRSLKQRRIRSFFYQETSWIKVEEDPCKRGYCCSSLNPDDGGLSMVPVVGFNGSTSLEA